MKIQRCEKCGELIPPTAGLCPNCGAKYMPETNHGGDGFYANNQGFDNVDSYKSRFSTQMCNSGKNAAKKLIAFVIILAIFAFVVVKLSVKSTTKEETVPVDSITTITTSPNTESQTTTKSNNTNQNTKKNNPPKKKRKHHRRSRR